VLIPLLLIGSSMTAPQLAMQAAAQTVVDDSPGGMALAVNRMLGGIVTYATWPNEAPGAPRTMCVIGTPRLTERPAPDLPGRGSVSVRRVSAAAAIGGAGCHMLYLGQMPAVDRQRLIGWVRGKAVLTVTDDDSNCNLGAMFCLNAQGQRLSFSVNLDSIGRGTVRVDPRVLKIGSDGGPR
jgi:hypothetical protein